MIAIIADDLTGAAEIAGLGWRHGLRAEILERDEKPGNEDLVVYDADTRDCSVAEARRRVTRIARRLRACRPEWIYKKVDSVLRGNVLAEIDALCRVWPGQRCLLVPANPSAGRVIKDGRYFIKGVPLNQTDFRFDPAHPRRSARVRELLGASRRLPVVLRHPTSGPLPAGIVVGEAASLADVRRWARRMDAGTVAAGGADFFAALLRQHGFRPPRSARHSVSCVAGTTLFVSGSLAESSLNFLAGCAAREWPVLMMPYELFAGLGPARAHCAVWARRVIEALGQQPRVAIGIGQSTLPGRREGARLGRWLTETVRQVLAAVRPDRVCVEGGSTSAQLLRRLGWKRLNIECEFRRGVTAVRPPVRNGALLVFKPGSYDWPAVLTQ